MMDKEKTKATHGHVEDLLCVIVKIQLSLHIEVRQSLFECDN
jgi:hypothetical protein